MLVAVLIALTLSLAWPLGALALTRRGGTRPATSARFDAIVVLGCRVRADGSASAGLARRVALAAELYGQGLAPRVVLSGGVVGGPISEASAALPLLLARGVPRDAVVLEERSTTTRENARCTHAMLASSQSVAPRLLVVTHAYHAPRARILFRRELRDVETAGASSPLELRGAFREVPLFVLTWLGVT